MLGNKRFAGKGLMSLALRLMCSYIIDKYNLNITLKVIADNKIAKAWYKKNGFAEKVSRNDYVFMELLLNNFNYIEYKLKYNL
jgi:RimJ/RimL family protein N-acetyltransferase